MENILIPDDREKGAPAPNAEIASLSHQNGNSLGETYLLPEYPEDSESALNLRELWRKILRRKWLIVIIVLAATTIVTVEVFRIKSVYQATTTIELGKENPLLVKTADIVIESDDSDLQTAMFLLRSRPLLEDVADNLKLDQNPKLLDGAKRRSLWEVFKGESKQPPPEREDDSAEESRESAAAGKLAVKSSRPREERNRLAPFVGHLKGGLGVEQIKGTRLINLSFTHTDPEMAATVANSVAQHFIERSFNKKTQKYSETSAWLDTATRKLESQMKQAEQEMANYTRANGIFSTDGKEDLTITKLAHLHDQVMRAETDRLIKQSLYEEVQRGHVAQLPEAFANSSTTDLQKKLSELTIIAAQMSVRFGSRNPRTVEMQQQIAAIRQEIEGSRGTLAEKLKADYERAVRDEGALKAALDRAKAEAVQQNQAAIQYNILKQNVETAKALYTDFLQKTSKADAEMAEQHREISIAEPAETPGSPVGPLRFRAILLAFVLSLAGSVGVVFLLDHLDNTVKTVEDVNRYARLPALGVIPTIAQNRERGLLGKLTGKELARNGYNAGGPAEAYRLLRTSVLLATAEHPPRTILVTSSQPGEGKTTTVVNTGISLAHLGAHVLIIDADMRRPRVHKVFNIQGKQGLSTYLSREADLKDLVRPSGVPNLWLLGAGLIPPNSADLVSSRKMTELLKSVTARFDHILIDSPPVVGVADPVILSRLVDGVILVVHGGKSTREMVRHARQELTNVGAKIFGVVLNNVNPQRDGYNYYHYQSNYRPVSNGKKDAE